ncbi:MAG: DMT family transporter [Acidimicrobiia bacterium]|nr:DMT family transporter [Acidimicrobiia bacterium]NNL27058.1 DMT family transporter [Acidimicrobiia bacterium]
MSRPLTNIGSRPAAYGPTEWGLTAVIGVIWGSAFLWIAIGVDSLAPGVVALGRVTLGALGLVGFSRARKTINRSDWVRISAVALFGNAGPALLFAIAETELDSAVAGMLTSAAPIMSLIVASLFLRRLPGAAQTIGISLGFGGIVLMTIPSLQGADAAPTGVMLVLIAVVGYGISGNLLVPLQQQYGGIAVTMWALIISTIMLLPFGIATWSESEFTIPSVLAVVILGVLGTGIVRSLAATLAGRVGAARMSTTTYLIPVTAIALGVLFRGETVGPLALAGVLIVISGAFLASRAEKA